jgi:hypothetical protein
MRKKKSMIAPTLSAFVEKQLARPVPPAVRAMAEHVLSLHPHAVAILAYGSTLRGVDPRDTLIDLYVLVDRDEALGGNWASRFFGRLFPPNVYYAETLFEDASLRCKYAVVTLAAFAARMQSATANPYFWARFSQPAALVFARMDAIKRSVADAVAAAIATMYAAGRASTESANPLMVWQHGFEETYRTELRPEGSSRAAALIAADADYYREAASLLDPVTAPSINWPARRIAGKLLSLARLAKAAFTFSGGASYAAWKIERHTGEAIVLSPWQKRHPLLAGIMLLPKLLRRGALR